MQSTLIPFFLAVSQQLTQSNLREEKFILAPGSRCIDHHSQQVMVEDQLLSVVARGCLNILLDQKAETKAHWCFNCFPFSPCLV